MDMWKRNGAGLVVVLVLSGCSAQQNIETVETPKFFVSCPDPDDRKKLTAGDTFRDLARAHADAVNAWERCHDTTEINAGRMPGSSSQ